MMLDDRLRIVVIDPGCTLEPCKRQYDPETPGGFGLYLAHELSDTSGVGHDAVGPTRVWSELMIDRALEVTL